MSIRSLVLKNEARQQAAANWVLRLQAENVSEETTVEWLAWCEADERNRQAFEEMAAIWELSGSLDPSQHGQGDPDQGLPILETPSVAKWSAVAAVAAVIIAGLALLVTPLQDRSVDRRIEFARLETPIGAAQTATLRDGSKVELGGRTSLTVRYSKDARMIVAEQGEAYFEVAKNPTRPFVVQAGPLTVTAIGTAFSVERFGDTAVVTVTEGTVEVRTTPSLKPDRAAKNEISLRASAGDRIRFDRGELVQATEPVALDSLKPWKTGRLEFRDEPLRLVVARINRYSEVQLEIGDPSIADLRVTTTFYSDRVSSWLTGIEMALPVKVARPNETSALILPAA